MLSNSWAAIFCEQVFCQIDEQPFAVLYSPDRGRANFPVNILLALELVKHIFDYTYTDEIFLDPYHFNYQIMFALGERNLGKRYLAPRTFYHFRLRFYRYHFPQESCIHFEKYQKNKVK